MDLEMLIDKIDFSQGARQIAKQALELGMKYQKDGAWHPVEELPEHNRRIVGLTKVRKRFKHLNFLGSILSVFKFKVVGNKFDKEK